MAFSDTVNCIHSASQGRWGSLCQYWAQVARPDKLIIPIIGDGSVMMNIQELNNSSQQSTN